MKEPTSITKCGHVFEKSNIKVWLKNQGKCPLCRVKFNYFDLIQISKKVSNDVVTTT